MLVSNGLFILPPLCSATNVSDAGTDTFQPVFFSVLAPHCLFNCLLGLSLAVCSNLDHSSLRCRSLPIQLTCPLECAYRPFAPHVLRQYTTAAGDDLATWPAPCGLRAASAIRAASFYNIRSLPLKPSTLKPKGRTCTYRRLSATRRQRLASFNVTGAAWQTVRGN